ncbi:MAG: indolepyruvate oxidoreductase subunit beta [Candidatus Staskawiczbacteria bacterium]|nr:indolepyruvate oxidoreductase subunit beta [Candidatus Staskawiczbacteria bacterium]
METFNLIVNGVGGQGVITLLILIDQAAMNEGYDVRSSELHGLSQRGGSVETHIRFGKKVNSPLIENGKADLILSLEILEALRETEKSGKQTKFLVNDYFLPFQGGLPAEEIKKQLDLVKNETYIIPASKECKEKLQNEIVCTLYSLGYAVAKNLIPLKKESVLKAIEQMVPEKYKELNINAFNLGYAS